MPLARIVAWYKRYERPFSSLSLIGGFVFDAITLRRVDTFWENFWIIIHLVVVAVAILVLNRKNGSQSENKETELDFWMVNLLQFTFGGLLSAFLVFYFRSATLSVSWPFLLILALAFAANERLKRHYARLAFQISLLFLSLFSFAIFFVPVLVGSIGIFIFLLSGVLSLIVIRLFLKLLERISHDRVIHQKKYIQLSIGVIFLGVNVLYFTNLIPPIPLSLKDGGIYHSISRDAAGNYLVSKERGNFLDYFRVSDTVHYEPGRTLFAYTAIFSPAKFSTNIVHEWQYWDDKSGVWVTVGKISLPISGGRGQGYRTYTESSVRPGKWRVNVETSRGQVIGRINFKVEMTEAKPEIVIEKH